MEIHDNEIERDYQVISFEDKDWNEEIEDMYSTLTTDDSEPVEDRYDEDGIPSVE